MQEPNTIFTLFTLLISSLFATLCYLVAKKRIRNEKIWAVLGLFFGIFAFIVLICLPKKKTAIEEPVQESCTLTCVQNESAASLDSDDPYEAPKAPRLSGNKSLSWYYIDPKDENTIKGPFFINDLRKAIQAETLNGSTYIWCEEFEEWTIISDFSNSTLVLDPDFIE